MTKASKTVYLDTGGLWCLDALVKPDAFVDERHLEYLAYLCDYLCLPSWNVKLIAPSSHRLGAVLPSFLEAMNGYVDDFHQTWEVVPREDLGRFTFAEIEEQIKEFKAHALHDLRAIRRWYTMHTQESVRPGWDGPVPSDEWSGVDPAIREHVQGHHSAWFENFGRQMAWGGMEEATRAFSLIQRAYPYWRYAAQMQAAYHTHPLGWQVIPNGVLREMPSELGIFIGGVVAHAIRQRILRADPDAILEFLARVRQRLTALPLGQGPSGDVTDAVRECVRLALPGQELSEQTKWTIQIGMGGVYYGLVRPRIPPEAHDIADRWFYFVDVALPQSIAKLVHPRPPHAVALALDVVSCRLCGAETEGGACKVCADRGR